MSAFSKNADIVRKPANIAVPGGMQANLYNLSLPYYRSKGSDKKVLFIFDAPIRDDVYDNKLVGDRTLALLHRMLVLSKHVYDPDLTVDFNWAGVLWRCWGTNHLEEHQIFASEQFFKDRILKIVRKSKPDSIVEFGTNLLHLHKLSIKLSQHNVYGVPFDLDLDGFSTKLTCLPDLGPILNDDNFKGNGPSNLIGYVARGLANGIEGCHKFGIRGLNPKVRWVKDIPTFRSMLRSLKEAHRVAFDTETNGLDRVSSKLLTLQAATSEKKGWFLPILHQNTPFNGKELKSIVIPELREFFTEQTNKYHIYHNAPYDLSILISNLKIPYYSTPVWDTQSGEYILDENVRFLYSFYKNNNGKKTGYYALGDLAVQYGCLAYLKDDTIDKSERNTIADAALDDKIAKYGVLDVCVPFAIHNRQRQRAEAMRYEKYEPMVIGQESDKLHGFAYMTQNGLPADNEYLIFLAGDRSPIAPLISKLKNELYASSPVQELNKTILAERNQPATSGLFSTELPVVFNINKPEHRRRLFFNKLNLKPLNYGKSGAGSIDRNYVNHYASKSKEVAAYREITYASKIVQGFINPLIALTDEDKDYQIDQCIRPHYQWWKIVTGRISEYAPNMQQTPNTELGKHIKRIITAREGEVILKADYMAHEVRGWCLLSGDEKLADVFMHGLKLRDKFRSDPSDELSTKIELEGDIHLLNVAFFFSKVLAETDGGELKTLRKAIKGIIFGLIYGMSTGSLCKTIGKNREYVEKLVDKLFKRFPEAANWLLGIEKIARKQLYVESPLGRRRNLYGYLVPVTDDYQSPIYGAANRKARNSPIQGICSEFNCISVRGLQKEVYKRSVELNQVGSPGLKVGNIVHDSQEAFCKLDWFWWGIEAMRKSMTNYVADICEERAGFKFPVPLEIDMEIGGSLMNTQKLDWRVSEILRIMAETLVWQRMELGYEINPRTELNALFADTDSMPNWVKSQIEKGTVIDIPAAVKAAISVVRPQLSGYAT